MNEQQGELSQVQMPPAAVADGEWPNPVDLGDAGTSQEEAAGRMPAPRDPGILPGASVETTESAKSAVLGELPAVDCGCGSQPLVLFRLAGQRYALPLDAVERVIRAVAPTAVPAAPDFVLGLVNMAGRILPVISLRRCLGLAPQPVRLEDLWVIVRSGEVTLALAVDEVEQLRAGEAWRSVAVEGALPGAEWRVEGLFRLDGDIVLICDMQKLINPQHRELIHQATARAGS